MMEFHRGMLDDEVRTLAYRDAIAKTVKPGDVVIDLGCGSGILSFFACKAGASKVYAIEAGRMAGVAQFAARHLGFADRVEVIHELSTNVTLPERADVLITETMGSLGFDEHMLGYILDARARLLKENAAIVPRRVSIVIAPVELPAEYDRHIAWWSEPRYGFDLSPLRVFASNSVLFINLRPGTEVAAPAEIIGVDLMTYDSAFVRGEATFTATRDAAVHGFGVWFDSVLAEGVTLDSRRTQQTSWAQTFMPLESPMRVAKGDTINLEVETDDGTSWTWRGRDFHQTTWLAAAPYVRSR
ncbi:MAG TPA: 50S ribosomal protein L11 methyltransferase [Thermoanaerobaculia bacterium]|nr:50S ribosomal protein L11 methyltransferase [Thermoanaerobaculia bacterium]